MTQAPTFTTFLGRKPDFITLIQDSTESYHSSDWNEIPKKIPQDIKKNAKYLYFFLKETNHTISGIYVGKSVKNSTKRILTHIKGMNEFHNNPEKHFNSFYQRMYSQFFDTTPNSQIYLYIFKWTKLQPLKMFEEFSLEVDIHNAEALFIGYFSQNYPKAIINHEYVNRNRWEKNKINFAEIPKNQTFDIIGKNAKELWKTWSNWFLSEKDENQPIPLFETKPNNLEVNLKNNNKGLPILKKSIAMKTRIANAVQKVESSFYRYTNVEKSDPKKISLDPQEILFTDGLIYMAYFIKNEVLELNEEYLRPLKTQLKLLPEDFTIIPIYIGKTEAIGRNGGFSANLKGVSQKKNPGYYARWGYDQARHIGGLSSRFFNIPNLYPSTDYEKWIQIMFDPKHRENKIPKLNFPIYFQMKPWYPYNITFQNLTGIYTPELEAILIALGRNFFSDIMVNKNNR